MNPLPNEQWAVFYGALAVIVFVGSVSLTGAAYYFKRMESHFTQMHKISNDLTVLIFQNKSQDEKLATISEELDQVREKVSVLKARRAELPALEKQ